MLFWHCGTGHFSARFSGNLFRTAGSLSLCLIHTHTYTYTHTLTHTHTNTHTHTHTQTHTDTNTHTHTVIYTHTSLFHGVPLGGRKCCSVAAKKQVFLNRSMQLSLSLSLSLKR